jgi:hypothetical protein
MKIQVSLNSDKNNGYFTWKSLHIYNNISVNFLEWKNFKQIFREKQTPSYIR